jgi:hypothetical protein
VPHGLSAPAEAAPPRTTAARSVVTANRLRDGVPVYYAAADAWSPAIAVARDVAADAADALLAEAMAGPAAVAVVDAYVIEAVPDDGNAAAAAPRLRPVSLRERIRAFGPTTRPAGG